MDGALRQDLYLGTDFFFYKEGADAARTAQRRDAHPSAAPAHLVRRLQWCLVLEEKANDCLVASAASSVESGGPSQRRHGRVCSTGKQQSCDALVAGSRGAQKRGVAVLCVHCINQRPVLQKKASALHSAFLSALSRGVKRRRSRPLLFLARQRRLKLQQLAKEEAVSTPCNQVTYAVPANLLTPEASA